MADENQTEAPEATGMAALGALNETAEAAVAASEVRGVRTPMGCHRAVAAASIFPAAVGP